MKDNKLYSGVFRWLAIGLTITFVVGYALTLTPTLLNAFTSIGGWIAAVIIQIAIALLFGLLLRKIDYTTCIAFYIIYCVITGIDFACIFLTYEIGSVMFIFIVTAAIFGLLAFLGDKMKVDITNLGRILLFSLLGIIIVSIINVFVGSSELAILVSIAAIIIFMGYIIYDLKIIEPLARVYGEDKVAVFGAFQLYIDFVNLFIRLLELFGNRKD